MESGGRKGIQSIDLTLFQTISHRRSGQGNGLGIQGNAIESFSSMGLFLKEYFCFSVCRCGLSLRLRCSKSDFNDDYYYYHFGHVCYGTTFIAIIALPGKYKVASFLFITLLCETRSNMYWLGTPVCKLLATLNKCKICRSSRHLLFPLPTASTYCLPTAVPTSLRLLALHQMPSSIPRFRFAPFGRVLSFRASLVCILSPLYNHSNLLIFYRDHNIHHVLSRVGIKLRKMPSMIARNCRQIKV